MCGRSFTLPAGSGLQRRSSDCSSQGQILNRHLANDIQELVRGVLARGESVGGGKLASVRPRRIRIDVPYIGRTLQTRVRIFVDSARCGSRWPGRHLTGTENTPYQIRHSAPLILSNLWFLTSRLSISLCMIIMRKCCSGQSGAWPHFASAEAPVDVSGVPPCLGRIELSMEVYRHMTMGTEAVSTIRHLPR